MTRRELIIEIDRQIKILSDWNAENSKHRDLGEVRKNCEVITGLVLARESVLSLDRM